MTSDAVIQRFMEMAVKAAAKAVRVNSAARLNEALPSIIQLGDKAGPRIFCPRSTEKEKAVIIPEDLFTTDYFDADVCIEEVSGAIAETGSIICTSHGGKAVQAGLLPSHHVAIVPQDRIFETLDDYFESCREAPPTNITLETGPSRTADIELTLTVGVHGPERLSIIVF